MRTGLAALALALALAGSARAAQPMAVVVVPPGHPFPRGGAVGLFVPGDGATVSGEGSS